MPAKIFISYTSRDREWAHWIGVTLRDNGFVPLVHEWEIGAGENVARWMDESLAASDRLLGVFTDAYAQAFYSSSERWSAYWDDPVGRKGFFVPVEVERVTDWPPLTRALKRLSLIGLSETEAEHALLAFLEPPQSPATRPPFPGTVATTAKDDVAANTATPADRGGESLPERRPAWPTASRDVNKGVGTPWRLSRSQKLAAGFVAYLLLVIGVGTIVMQSRDGRNLTDKEIALMAARLQQNRPQETIVKILCVFNDPRSCQYARRWVTLFDQAQWKHTSVVPTEEVVDGLRIYVKDPNVDGYYDFISVFEIITIRPSVFVVPYVSPNEIRVIIGIAS